MILEAFFQMILNWLILGAIIIAIMACAAFIVKIVEKIADYILLLNSYIKRRLISHK